MLPKRFTNIYFTYDKFKRLHLLFQNDNDDRSLYFDGFDFTYGFDRTDLAGFSPLKNSIRKEDQHYMQINSIKQTDDDITFILFSDGTLFQIYFMLNDENSPQTLSEFSRKGENANAMTPLGITVYEAALRNYERGEEHKIKTV